ncbi:hypothetical protein ACFCXT_19765 [Streptomyces vinaceus]|uniref:hypothetical protein n=1 Tax=Streptomyces vinaceus TaxID=1960 RepID=UPI0035DF228D
MSTGHMGDCVSMIVIWGQQDGRYEHVRGYHGFGGFQNIDLESLFHEVPMDPDTKVFIGMGSLSSMNAAEHERIEEKSFVWAQTTVVVPERPTTNFTIDRWGVLTYEAGAESEPDGYLSEDSYDFGAMFDGSGENDSWSDSDDEDPTRK